MQPLFVTVHIKYLITFNATFDINEFTTYLPCPQPDGGHCFPIVQFYSGKGAIHLWWLLYLVSLVSPLAFLSVCKPMRSVYIR